MDDSEPGIVYQPLVDLIEEQEDELAPERLSVPKSCVVILIIEILSLLVNVTLCISGNIAGSDGRIWLVFLVIINFAVLILLANGLFGREFRLSSLPIVVGLKAFSTIYWTKVFVFVIFDVDFMKEWLLQFVHSIPLDFDLMTLQMCIAAVVFFVASYHAFAAWMIVTIVFFVINVLSAFGYTSYMLESIVVASRQGVSVLGFCIALLAVFLLGNALWGQQHRKNCLTAYICFFELLPILFYSAMVLVFSFGFFYFRRVLQEEFDKEMYPYNATVVLIVLILGTLISDLYHIAAAWAINQY